MIAIDPVDFLLNSPLYKKYDLTNILPADVSTVLNFHGHLDCYCPECNKQSIFNTPNIVPGMDASRSGGRTQMFDTKVDKGFSLVKEDQQPPYKHENKTYKIELTCSRKEAHRKIFYLMVSDNKLFKIGQYPSLMDLSGNDLDKFRRILTEEKLAELKTSYSLYTHGVGIGSFVYLRRIFEDLINEIHAERSQTAGWDEERYKELSTELKIDFFRDDLPDFMVKNKFMYKIMSLGIHQLTEEDCLEHYFRLLKGIKLILQQKLNKIEEKKLEVSVESDLHKSHSKIKSK